MVFALLSVLMAATHGTCSITNRITLSTNNNLYRPQLVRDLWRLQLLPPHQSLGLAKLMHASLIFGCDGGTKQQYP